MASDCGLGSLEFHSHPDGQQSQPTVAGKPLNLVSITPSPAPLSWGLEHRLDFCLDFAPGLQL